MESIIRMFLFKKKKKKILRPLELHQRWCQSCLMHEIWNQNICAFLFFNSQPGFLTLRPLELHQRQCQNYLMHGICNQNIHVFLFL